MNRCLSLSCRVVLRARPCIRPRLLELKVALLPRRVMTFISRELNSRGTTVLRRESLEMTFPLSRGWLAVEVFTSDRASDGNGSWLVFWMVHGISRLLRVMKSIDSVDGMLWVTLLRARRVSDILLRLIGSRCDITRNWCSNWRVE